MLQLSLDYADNHLDDHFGQFIQLFINLFLLSFQNAFSIQIVQTQDKITNALIICAIVHLDMH